MDMEDAITCEEIREMAKKNPHMFDGITFNLKRRKISSNSILNFQAKIDNVYYPNIVDLQYSINDTIDQGSHGICYMCATLHQATYILWRYCKESVEFTLQEAMDCAGDYKRLTYDGRKKHPQDCDYGNFYPYCLYNFNSNLENHYFTSKVYSKKAELFKKAVDQLGGLYLRTIASLTKQNVMLLLSRYGAAGFAFDAAAWGLTGGHEITACGYNIDKGIYALNSWGNLLRYVFFSWDDLAKYGWDMDVFANQGNNLN